MYLMHWALAEIATLGRGHRVGSCCCYWRWCRNVDCCQVDGVETSHLLFRTNKINWLKNEPVDQYFFTKVK